MDIRRVELSLGKHSLFIAKYNNIMFFHLGDERVSVCEMHLDKNVDNGFKISANLTQAGLEALDNLQKIPGEYTLQLMPYGLHTLSTNKVVFDLFRHFICMQSAHGQNSIMLKLLTGKVYKRMGIDDPYDHITTEQASDIVTEFNFDEAGEIQLTQCGVFQYQ